MKKLEKILIDKIIKQCKATGYDLWIIPKLRYIKRNDYCQDFIKDIADSYGNREIDLNGCIASCCMYF